MSVICINIEMKIQTNIKIIFYIIIILQFVVILNLVKENGIADEMTERRSAILSKSLSERRLLFKNILHDYERNNSYDKYKKNAGEYAFLLFISMSYDYSEIYYTGACEERNFLKKLYDEKIITDDNLSDPFGLRNSFSEIKDIITFGYCVNPLVTKDLESYDEFTKWLRSEILENSNICDSY